jgi:chitinase
MNPLPSRAGVFLSIVVFCFAVSNACAGNNINGRRFAVVAYFHGDTVQLKHHPLEELTHICYSFLHLKGNRLTVDNKKDSLSILYLTSLKKQHPQLKILLSLGGWGGCRTCSEVFFTDSGRSEFAASAVNVLREYNADGLDLDWEYPSVEGYPGHQYLPDDRNNFTILVQKLREEFGRRYELTFAAGATTACLTQSIDWKRVMPSVDRVHLMTYDLKNGYSTITGHHTPLYSTPDQNESTDSAVRFLDSLGVPDEKIVIGAAFYARVWQNVENKNDGLYQAGTFLRYVGFKDFDSYFGKDGGFVYHWDSTAQAPFEYSPERRIFATFDDRRSVALKTQYAIARHLGGIMFWELTEDTDEHGLLDAIDKTVKELRMPPRQHPRD